jgi:hypothetical protein
MNGSSTWLEDGFKSGARCYGSCLSTVAGAIFNLERGLNVPQDEDITHPEGFFRGMATWDRVMALPYQDRMRAFRDPEIRKATSAEAVAGTVAQQGGMTDRRGGARGLFNRRWETLPADRRCPLRLRVLVCGLDRKRRLASVLAGS